jgi:molybdopterin-binding protein
MELSARNQLPGVIKSVTLGTIMAEIVIDIGGKDVVADITRASAKRLKLKKGDAVTAIIKSTEVLVGK